MTTIAVPLRVSYPPSSAAPAQEAAALIARAAEAAGVAVARACAAGDLARAAQIVAAVEALAGEGAKS